MRLQCLMGHVDWDLATRNTKHQELWQSRILKKIYTNITLSAGDHWQSKMSMERLPWLLMLG